MQSGLRSREGFAFRPVMRISLSNLLLPSEKLPQPPKVQYKLAQDTHLPFGFAVWDGCLLSVRRGATPLEIAIERFLLSPAFPYQCLPVAFGGGSTAPEARSQPILGPFCPP